jgi:uncharacterized protein (TIGR03435 family)
MTTRVLTVLAFMAAAVSLRGQTSPPAVPTFDVAAIKRSTSLDVGSVVQPGGRYMANGVTLRMLLKIAYGMHDDQFIGGPDWIDKDRFEVNAKAEGYPDAAAFVVTARLMLRPLLADRFKLVLRSERRELPVYVLTLLRSARDIGPQLRISDERTCGGPAAPLPISREGFRPQMELACGAQAFFNGLVSARAQTMANLVVSVTRFADRLVLDETGLTGKYDWQIFWAPPGLTVDGRIDGPSLEDAFREQAGLKLEAKRRSVDVFVIEHAERPVVD